MENWKEKFKVIEKQEEWYYDGIDFMEEIIEKNPDDRDAYLNICYCIVNAIIYKPTIDDYCDNIFNYYLNISYEKFKNDPIYLHFMAEIISYTDWVVRNSNINFNEMFKKALCLEPNNLMFKVQDYNNKIYEIVLFDKSNERKENIKKMEDEIDNFCEILIDHYDVLIKKCSEVGRIGELEEFKVKSLCGRTFSKKQENFPKNE